MSAADKNNKDGLFYAARIFRTVVFPPVTSNETRLRLFWRWCFLVSPVLHANDGDLQKKDVWIHVSRHWRSEFASQHLEGSCVSPVDVDKLPPASTHTASTHGPSDGVIQLVKVGSVRVTNLCFAAEVIYLFFIFLQKAHFS